MSGVEYRDEIKTTCFILIPTLSVIYPSFIHYLQWRWVKGTYSKSADVFSVHAFYFQILMFPSGLLGP